MKVGSRAPNFVLKDENGNDWKLSEYLGETITLLFYPKDNSTVCTKQLCSIRDNWSDYEKTKSIIVGISTDSIESHKNFTTKYDFPFPLLSDKDGKVVKKYGIASWIPGKSARAIVVVDENGKIKYHQVQTLSVFRPKDKEVLRAIKR